MAQDLVQQQETKSWKFKVERNAKGFVRITCHSDSVELVDNWIKLHDKLESLGERVEKVAPEE